MPNDLPKWPDKDPADIADYTLSFADLLPADDPIIGAAWTIVPAGLTINAQAFSGRSAIITLSNGQSGATYRATATVNSSQRTFQRSVTLFVREM